MLGKDSFLIREEGDKVIAVYASELMKEWKGMVGFSGTVDSCVT